MFFCYLQGNYTKSSSVRINPQPQGTGRAGNTFRLAELTGLDFDGFAVGLCRKRERYAVQCKV